MSISKVIRLRVGDEVVWNDPDDGICSRKYVIASIKYKGGIVSIVDKNGDCLECFARELS
jgi:hypothetical protein